MKENTLSPSLIENLILSRRPGFALPFAVEEGKVTNFPLANIMYIVETEDGQVVAYFQDYLKSEIVITEDLNSCAEKLKPFAFILVDQSHLLNLSFLDQAQYLEDSCVYQLHGGKKSKD